MEGADLHYIGMRIRYFIKTIDVILSLFASRLKRMRKAHLLLTVVLILDLPLMAIANTNSQDSMPVHYILIDSLGRNFNLEKNLLALTQKELQNPSLPWWAKDLPQGYGTQYVYEEDRNIMYPIKDMARVDQLRKSVGLGPLKEYMEEAKIYFK